MKVHPRLAMELARHSDLRLTMKTYTDAGQLPLQEVMDGLPSFGFDSRLDSRKLVPVCPPVSAPVQQKQETETGNPLVNKGDCHHLSPSVTASHQKSEWRREGDSNYPNQTRQRPIYKVIRRMVKPRLH
jgi:hypothetical protein